MSTTSTWAWCSTRRSVGEFISYGDLISPGEYRLHSRFRRAINFAHGSQLVSLVDESVGAGPLNVVLTRVAEVGGECLLVGDDSMQVGTVTLDFAGACRYDSSLAMPTDSDSASFDRGLSFFKETLRVLAPAHSLVHLRAGDEDADAPASFEAALAERFVRGCHLLEEGEYAAGTQWVKGIGYGLTPSGDDFLCGFLIALHLRRLLFGENTAAITETVFHSAASRNPLSMSFLQCARRGRVSEKLRNVVTAIVKGEHESILTATRALASVGETSGADTATGLIFGLESCRVAA